MIFSESIPVISCFLQVPKTDLWRRLLHTPKTAPSYVHNWLNCLIQSISNYATIKHTNNILGCRQSMQQHNGKRLKMLTRKYRSPLAIFLILAALPITSNRNKKHVKCEVIQAEDLCELGRFFSDDVNQATAVEDLHLMRPVEVLPEKEEKHKPTAVVHGFERCLLGSGAHREVRSEIAVELLDLGLDGRETSFADDCELVLLESLSNGIFADPFLLNRLQHQKAVKYAQIYGDVDLERPARNSFQSIVALHQRLVPDKRNGLEVLYRSEVTMPLHARYPLVSAESYFLVNITPPHVLIYCRRGYNATGTSANLKQELCINALLGCTVAKTLQWSIPSGNPGHSASVTRLTTFSALAGVLAILFASKISSAK